MVELKNEDFELESFAQMTKKVGVAKAKTNLQSWAATNDIDQ